MIQTAVILAAGLGSRLKDLTKNKPKGFLKIGELPIIEESIKKLIEIGIERIIIGTGYLSEQYDSLKNKYTQVESIKNPKYDRSGSMYTLYLLKESINEDFLLLESDIIYDKNGLKTLINEPARDAILASNLTNMDDAVYIETDQFQHVKKLTKQKKELSEIFGELVGISKVSYNTYIKLCQYSQEHFQQSLLLDYEQAMVGLQNEKKHSSFFVKKIPNFIWCEIDNSDHFDRAKKYIYPLIAQQEDLVKIKRAILLTPGPATTTDSVKYAQVVEDICPREEDFGQIMKNIASDLTDFVGNNNNYTTILFGGSGTAAVEAILSSVIDGTALIIDNGAYGKRMEKIADIYNISYITYNSPSYSPLNLSEIEGLLIQHKEKITHLCIVHHETTTGLLNDIKAIGYLCKKYNVLMIVDAISSYAAIPIQMEEMNISYLAGSSNKGLQGMPGVSFVIANKQVLEETKKMKPRNYYLHLFDQYKFFEENLQTRFTPPIQTLLSLKQAILETKQEGITNRYNRYSKSWKTLIDGLASLKLSYLVPLEYQSKLITAVLEPSHPNYNFKDMHDFLKMRDVIIYPGKITNQETFRVGTIGNIDYKDIQQFLIILEEYFNQINFY
jgi:2-aminoethylphosphonate-pyruvate transaminase